MARVGGYLDLLALEADGRAYDDVVSIIFAEADAAEEARLEARAKASLSKGGG